MPYLKPLESRLSRRFFIAILGLIVVIFGIIYAYSVPLIKQKVFEIERNASRLALNNVFELANRMYANVEEYHAQALDAHQQQLKVAVALSESYVRHTFREALKKGIPLEQARQQAFTTLRDFSYGNKDYIWIADYQGILLSHPDPRYHGKSSDNMRDSAGNPIVANVVKLALKDGEGFYRYQWQRLAEAEPLDKVSYVKNYPEWGLVIGSGVYLDDLEKEIKNRRERALLELRDALQEIKVAKTGYMYIFDSQSRMLIHPNPNIDRTQFQNLKNPVTGNSIAADLIKVADTGQELHYQWDKPSDPGNYSYEKLSLVRYLPGFDWYICSSVYLDELYSSSETLSDRILILAALTMLGAIVLAYLFANRITRPLEQQIKQRGEELLETNARAQRMNAVGQLAGGLAHDFNNLLSIILGNLLLARDRYKQVHGLDDFLTPAIRASRRSADITHRLLAFSRRQPLQPVAVDVEQLLTETVELLRGSLPATIELNYHNDTTPLLAHVDPSHLENALVNLALNARDAMPQGGSLHFHTRLVYITDAPAFDEPVETGHYVEIRLNDTGNGFSEEAKRLAFEPFFSTKSGTNNSGLGLSMVYGFVKQSNGYICIANQAERGASITLLLPAAAADATLNSRSRDGQDVSALAGKLILLVEDNADVREVVRAQLTNLGLHVVEAEDADEAQQLIDSLPNLDGMVSDIMLPGELDGQQLAQRLYQKNAHSLILLISGYAHEASSPATDGVTFPLLRKPFDQQSLSHALWQASQQEEKQP